jgi:hypothetical protein
VESHLATTNLLLGIMAAVSVLEALLLIGVGIAAFLVYRRVMALISGIEERHVGPAMVQVHGILEDVKGVTTRVRAETERVDQAIRTTIGRVDDTAERVRWNVRAKTSRLVAILRGARVAIESMLNGRESA